MKSIDIFFSSQKMTVDGHEEALSAEGFASLVAGDVRGLDGQAKELYAFVEGIGQGTVRGPRHHTYGVEKPYRGHYVHFASGTPAFIFVVGAVVAAWAATAIGWWFVAKRRKSH